MPILKSNIVLLLSALALFAAELSYFVFGLYWTKLVVDTLLLGAAIIVSTTWFTAALDAFRAKAVDAGDKIVLTVWITWTAILIQRLYVIVGTALDRPQWWVDSPGSITVTTLVLIAGAYASYATVGDAHVPIRERRFVLMATFIGGLVVGGTLVAAIVFNLHF